MLKLGLVTVAPDPELADAGTVSCIVHIDVYAVQVVQIPWAVGIDDVEMHARGNFEPVGQVEEGAE